MDLGLADARVVVTGGASNIGRGIVHAFAAEGARIVINDIDVPQADKVRAEAEGIRRRRGPCSDRRPDEARSG